MTTYYEPERVSVPNKSRVTSHQRWALEQVKRRSQGGRYWVSERAGTPAALGHLYRKGLLERRQVVGPRGGRWYEYRPVDKTWLADTAKGA